MRDDAVYIPTSPNPVPALAHFCQAQVAHSSLAPKRLLKAYLLKESLDRLWTYRYEGAMMRYLNAWIDQLRWQRLNRLRKNP